MSSSLPKVIHFYRLGERYGNFSNFSHHPVEIAGKIWPTTEHYFQAMKFEGSKYEEDIRQAFKPGGAKRKGASRAHPLRPDWEEVKEGVMKTALFAKFRQYPELRKLLLSTEDSKLVERTDSDSYWGDGRDHSGKNRLGFLLMEVREALRAEV